MVFASQNLSKHWTLGAYPIKNRIQRAVIPKGLVVNPDKREYLTKNINKLFLIRPSKSRDTEGRETKKVGENTDLSC